MKPAGETSTPRRRGGLPIDAAAKEGLAEVDGQKLKLTHLDKLYFPAAGYRKRDLLDFYHDIADFLVPHLRGRPYSMLRYPDGIAGKSFFQKNAGERLPEWIARVRIASHNERGSIQFVLCDNAPTLLYLVNLGCIDHHVWMSRAETPQAPDFVLLDLDPGPRAGLARVIGVARAIRAVLERFEIHACLKTSGATGLHILIPLGPGHSYRQTADFAALIMRLAAGQVPELATEVWQVSRRPEGRVYMDFRQNAYGKTIPPPYAVRPREGAPVSTPLAWRELTPRLDPSAFTLRTLARRLDRYGDLMAGILPGREPQRIADLLARIEAKLDVNGLRRSA